VLAGLHAAYGQIRLHAGAVSEAVVLCREALRLVDKTEHPAMRPSVWVATLFAEHLAGNFEPALRLAERALAETSERPSDGVTLVGASPHVWLLYFRGQLLVEMGRAELGAPDLERAETLARTQGELEMLGYYHGARVRLALFLGDVECAPEHARCALELAEKVGSSVSRAEAFAALGLASLLGGRFDEAATAYERALAIGRERRVGLAYEPVWLAELAEARLGAGDAHGACSLIERALELSDAGGLRPAHMRALMALARLRRAEGSHAEEEALGKARALMHASGALGWEPLLQSRPN
jgi:tetratricopeptide (TPR) repeat protein